MWRKMDDRNYTTNTKYCSLCDRRPSRSSDVVELSCRHVFCVVCFGRYREDKQAGSVMRIAALPCPVCRLVVEVPVSPSSRSPSDRAETTPVVPECDDENDDSVPQAPAPTTADIQSPKFLFPPVDQDDEDNDSTDTLDAEEVNGKNRKNDSFDDGCHWRLTLRSHTAPTGVTFTSDGLVALACYGIYAVKILRPCSWDVTQLIEDQLKPFSISLAGGDGLTAAYGYNALLVGDRWSKTVSVVEAETGVEQTRWTPGMFSWLGGVTGVGDNVAVNCRELHAVGVYTADGHLLSRFSTGCSDDRQADTVDYLTSDDRGRIIVSDSSNHCVKVFDAAGGGSLLLRAGTGRGIDDGQLTWPKGVCVDDATGDIIVADCWNRRVSRFDATSGCFIEHLLTDVERPLAVTYRTAGGRLLAVTHYSLSGRSICDLYKLDEYRSSYTDAI